MTFRSTHRTTALAALSIFELAIALTIIALIVGGIIVIQDINRQADSRKIVAGMMAYESAYVTFRDKYSALPGDMRGATAKWGFALGTASDAACQNTISTTKATCDGNGNGRIDTSVVAGDEGNRAWQHMSNAELIEGTFVGTTNGVPASNLLVNTLPSSKVRDIGYQFRSEDKLILGWASAPEGTAPILALRVASVAGMTLGANALSPFTIKDIDEKMDDNMPGLGKIFIAYNAACASSTAAATANYTTTEDIACFFHYNLEK
jgi:hypothetical protein